MFAHTSGIAYTKLPMSLAVETESPTEVVVRNKRVDVARKVKCICRFVYKDLGSGSESSKD